MSILIKRITHPRLKNAVTLPGIFITGITSALIVLLIGVFHYREAQNQFNAQANLAQRLFTENLSQDILLGQYPLVYARCSKLLNEPLVFSILVTAASGEAICDLKKSDLKISLLETTSRVLFKKDSVAAAKIVISFDQSFLNQQFIQSIILSALAASFAILSHWIIFLFITRILVRPINEISTVVSTNDLESIQKISLSKNALVPKELEQLAFDIGKMAMQIQSFQAEAIRMERKVAISELALQVSHDIRAPIAALELIAKSPEAIGSEFAEIVVNSVFRISQIARDLLSLGKVAEGKIALMPKASPPVHLAKMLGDLVKEKNIQYVSRASVRLPEPLPTGIFIQADEGYLARVISNLIQNSVDADSGSISIYLHDEVNICRIVLKDNGEGIPPSVIKRIGEKGFSTKSGMADSGSGIGLFHATQFIESRSGTLKINSEEGVGTTIEITLPKAPAPAIFVQNLEIGDQENIIFIKPDEKNLRLFKSRLLQAFPDQPLKGPFVYNSTDEFANGLSNLPTKDKTIFLTLGSTTKADEIFEFAKLAGPERDLILLTSRYDDALIFSRAEELHLRILPLVTLPTLPIKKVAQLTRYDAIVIDNDTLILKIWELSSKKWQRNIRCFSRSEDFFNAQEEISRNSPIFVDFELGEISNGDQIAKKIAGLGFSDISISTGRSAASISVPACVRRVVGKEPIFGALMS